MGISDLIGGLRQSRSLAKSPTFPQCGVFGNYAALAVDNPEVADNPTLAAVRNDRLPCDSMSLSMPLMSFGDARIPRESLEVLLFTQFHPSTVKPRVCSRFQGQGALVLLNDRWMRSPCSILQNVDDVT